MNDGIIIGTPISRFQPVRNPGSALCFTCVSSWIMLMPRYSASIETSPARIAQPADGVTTTAASAP